MSFLSGRTSLTTVQTSNIAANAIDSTLTKDALIADYTEVTIAAGDSLLLGDVGDSGNTKRDTVQGLLDLAGGGFTLDTEQATTSGTSFTFNAGSIIPAGTTMIVIMFEGVSFSGTNNIRIQIGDGGGIETGSYLSSSMRTTDGNTVDAGGSITNGFDMYIADAAATITGNYTLCLKDSSNFTWIGSGVVRNDTNSTTHGGGSKTLSAELTQVKILLSASDTFDAGSINIMYQ
jgi:hypothetical protein